MGHAKTESVPLTSMAERGCGGWGLVNIEKTMENPPF
jgi:hypothetical protein